MGKVYDGIIGLVVGDALGVPYEFRQRDTFKATGMAGYMTYNQQPGTWSDDSALTLATLESIGRRGRIDLADIMSNFASWLARGDFSARGDVFDVGTTTRAAIRKRIMYHISPEQCGGTSERDNGNGSLMRILPLAFIKHSINDVYAVSSLTHAHFLSRFACEFYVDVATALIDGCEIGAAIKQACFGGLPEEFKRLEFLSGLNRDQIKSTGFVVHTLEAALWCLLHTDNYKDCVLMAVNLGDDTDTVAAVAGGLAGIIYGVGGQNGIPEEWVDKIARHFWIKDLCEDFESKYSI